VTFAKSGSKDIKFYVDDTITYDTLVEFDVFDANEISWSVKNSTKYDLANSYYQRNGKGSQKTVKKNQTLDRSDFEEDFNYVLLVLKGVDGSETEVKSRLFRTIYRDPSYVTSTGTTSSTSTGSSSGSYLRSDGLRFKSGYYQYITGYGDGEFKPANPISRAEFVSILSEITIGGNATNASFSDISSAAWYGSAVNRMAGLGVAFSFSTDFRPDDDITRAEAAAMLNRLGLHKQIQQPMVFTDISGHALYSDIVEASQKGLIYGYVDGTFKPEYRISRVEAVAIINRALGRGSDSSSVMSGAKFPPDMNATDWGYYDVVDAMNTHTLGTARSSTGYRIWTSLG
jgi:hypothetical protein